MKVYISIGFFTVREQEITTSETLFDNLLNTALNAIHSVCNQTPEALLCANMIDFPEKYASIRKLYTMQGPRRIKEIELLDSIQKDPKKNQDWSLVLNPVKGWITTKRLSDFVKAIGVASNPYCISTITLQPNYNMLWNSLFVDKKRAINGTVRQPQRGEDHIQTLQELDAKLATHLNSRSWQGSQFVSALQYDDGAIYAVKINQLDQICSTQLPDPEVVAYSNDEDSECTWIMKLPIFSTNSDVAQDLSMVERLLQCGH